MSAHEANLSADCLRSMLDYDPETGVFTWRESLGCRSRGMVAGCRMPNGYVRIKINGFPHMAHRLAWLHVVGRWPDLFIDHMNGLRSDNRFCNLRDVSKTVNAQNTDGSKSQTKGARRLKSLGLSRPWQARIQVCGKKIFLGNFETAELARSAYLQTKREMHACTRVKECA